MHIPSRPPSSRPFMAAPRPAFYHPAPVIDAALRGIERCIRRAEGVALVVGPPGTGKSLLLAKVVEHVRDDFDVALLAGGSICTRRALWQAVLAAIGEPFRGIDEADLRIAIVERVRGLAAAGSGLVILVDEAHTLPTRLIEELRLLTNVPTPLPAVHIVLAGTTRLDEMLAAPRLESLAQRIAVRCHLEPLDHATTVDYLRAQTRTAGLVWERLFEEGCDDAVFRLTDGVPRLVNLVCDQALVLVAESDRRVTPADIAAAWREIQRLPAPDRLGVAGHAAAPALATRDDAVDDRDDGFGVIEFGAGDDLDEERPARAAAATDDGSTDPWSGPDVELVFESAADPFAEIFAHEEPVVERFLVQGPDDFSHCRHVTSREGQSMGRLLATFARADDADRGTAAAHASEPPPPRMAAGALGAMQDDVPATATVETTDTDDDMVVIEEDLHDPPAAGAATVFSVRPGDYRSLFTRLRRGGA